jgi:hypothetical protein
MTAKNKKEMMETKERKKNKIKENHDNIDVTNPRPVTKTGSGFGVPLLSRVGNEAIAKAKCYPDGAAYIAVSSVTSVETYYQRVGFQTYQKPQSGLIPMAMKLYQGKGGFG